MEEKIENLDSSNQEEIVEPETDEPTEVGLPADPVEVEPKDDQVEDLEELKQRNQELYEQLKKAKGFVRDQKDGRWVKREKPKEVQGSGDITKTELYSLVKANVPDEDVNEVILYARSHKITATEALKLPEVKAILRTKAEVRKTAEAANFSSTRRGAPKVKGEDLVRNAEKGEAPQEEDIETFIRARLDAKKPKV